MNPLALLIGIPIAYAVALALALFDVAMLPLKVAYHGLALLRGYE